MIEGNNVLSTHRYDNTKENKDSYREGRSRRTERKEETKEDEPVVLSFAQLEGKCYCCGKPGHKSPQCYKKDTIPKEEWAINKTQLAQTRVDSANANSNATCSQTTTNEDQHDQHVGWAGVHASFNQNSNKIHQEILKKLILLDSDSNVTVFCEKSYVCARKVQKYFSST